jgi:hypothetical protein
MPSEEQFYCRYKRILLSFQQICKSSAVTQIELHKNHVGWTIAVHQLSLYKLNSHSVIFVKQSSFKTDGNVFQLLVE